MVSVFVGQEHEDRDKPKYHRYNERDDPKDNHQPRTDVCQNSAGSAMNETECMYIPLPGIKGPAFDVQSTEGNETKHDDRTAVHKDFRRCVNTELCTVS